MKPKYVIRQRPTYEVCPYITKHISKQCERCTSWLKGACKKTPDLLK